jgi:hypothetical protein
MIRKLLATAMLIALSALGVAVVDATPASAATVGCGSICNNQDPHTYDVCTHFFTGTFCRTEGSPILCESDALTKATKGSVQLRYSPFCRTAWAKYTGGSGDGVDVKEWVQTSTGHSYYGTNTSGPWSAMADDMNISSKACYSVKDVDGKVISSGCTTSY